MGLAGADLVYNLRHKGHVDEDMDRRLDQATERTVRLLSENLAHGLVTKNIDNW